MKTIIVRLGDFYTFYHYDEKNPAHGRYGSTLNREREVLEGMLKSWKKKEGGKA